MPTLHTSADHPPHGAKAIDTMAPHSCHSHSASKSFGGGDNEPHHDPAEPQKKNMSKQRRLLLISFIIIAGFMLIEAVGGWLTNSLALLSDAGHMLSDAAALGATLLAFKIGDKAATEQKTFGYKRFEILVAGANGATLIIIALMIFIEAIGRINSPPDIATKGMLIIATIGMLVNLFVAWMLHRGGGDHAHDHQHSHSPIDAHNHQHDQSHNHEQTTNPKPTKTDPDEHNHSSSVSAPVAKNLNMHSAYLHVLGDLLGSVAAIIAALAMMWFGWWWADPLASVVVAALILYSGYRVVMQSAHILMEGTPSDISLEQVVSSMQEHAAVITVHDLHVWTITSGLHALSCHVVVDGDMRISDASGLIHDLEGRLQTLGISHATIQVESNNCPQSHGDSLVCDMSEMGQADAAHLGHNH